MKKNWLFSRPTDLLVLFLPVWICWIVPFFLPTSLLQTETSLWVWVVFVIGIDVSHVWSTLFRTYLDKEEFHHHRNVLLLAPLVSFLLAFVIASLSFDLFWRCLAYVAVWHFVKQQYGIMRIYKAKARDFSKRIFSDNLAIYLSMLYPIIYWHLNLDRTFHWFVEGDFIQISIPESFLSIFNITGNILYFAILLGWLTEHFLKKEKIATGKVLWVLTTAGNWFIGIIYFNSDLVFTVTNVVAHGIPYFALIIFYQHKKHRLTTGIYKNALAAILIISIGAFLFAFSEEYLWDMLVYRDNPDFFSQLLSYPIPLPSPFWQTFALALLTVPQATHYIIDGFIWKNNKKNPFLKPILFS